MVSGGPSNEGAASILRAVGSLLVALSGGQAAQLERTLSEQQGAPAGTRSQANAPPVASTPLTGYPRPQRTPLPASQPTEAPRPAGGSADLLDEVELVLTDARERAQAIIDESTERARELIRQERAASGSSAIDPRALDDLRSGLRNLMTEVRDIQQRLARIERLIREQNERSAHLAAAAPITAPPPVAAQYAEPPYAEPQVAEAPYTERQYAEPPPEDDGDGAALGAADEDAPVYSPAPPPPPRSSFSVVPPQRREWTAPRMHEADAIEGAIEGTDVTPTADGPAYEPPTAPPRTAVASVAVERPEPDAWDADEDASFDASSKGAASPLVTFMPSDGAITLRVAPVAGFQGLMRVQDALTHLRSVRAASVDAYGQGEARLRIELSDASDSDEIAQGLTRALGETARVEEASEVHRELFITLR